MFIPDGMTEEEVLKDIEKIANEFASGFIFGYYGVDDIKQEIRLECLKALPKYDPYDKNGNKTRPLINFLFITTKRKIINLRRNKYRRTDPPCIICHQGRNSEHEDGKICRKYSMWKKLNYTKANLTRPLGLEGLNEETETFINLNDPTLEVAQFNELKLLIDKHLDINLRSDYLRMLAGEKPPLPRQIQIKLAIKKIIGEEYLGNFDEQE